MAKKQKTKGAPTEHAPSIPPASADLPAATSADSVTPPVTEEPVDPAMLEALSRLNEGLTGVGIPKLDLVSPFACAPQSINARYMDQQTLSLLVDNLKRDGRLESVPLVCPRASNDTAGVDKFKYDIISGHHRIEAAQKANLKLILVMVVEPASIDELRAKQLSHNAIVGRDDDVVLKKMYESITELTAQIYSGLQAKLDSISVVNLSFKAGTFQEFTIAFMPDDIVDYDAACKIVEDMLAPSGSEFRVDSIKNHEAFVKAISKIKRSETVKSNGAALSTMVTMALERLKQLQAERAAAQEKDDDDGRPRDPLTDATTSADSLSL